MMETAILNLQSQLKNRLIRDGAINIFRSSAFVITESIISASKIKSMYGSSEKSVTEALKEIFESTGLKVEVEEFENAYLITHRGETNRLVIEGVEMSLDLLNLLESHKAVLGYPLQVVPYSRSAGGSKTLYGWDIIPDRSEDNVITLHLSNKREYLIDCRDIDKAISSVKAVPVNEENLLRLGMALRFIKRAYEG